MRRDDFDDESEPDLGWRLADYLSSPRYWGLVMAAVVALVFVRAFTTWQPVLLAAIGYSASAAGGALVFFRFGGLIGAFLAFAVSGLPVQRVLSVVFGAGGLLALLLALLPVLFGIPPVVVTFSFCLGVIVALPPVLALLTLVEGRPTRVDLAGVVALPLVITGFADLLLPALLSAVYRPTSTAILPFAWLVLGFGLAALCLVLGRTLDFSTPAPPRHQPFAPRKRALLPLGAILLVPQVLFLLILIGLAVWPGPVLIGSRFASTGMLVVVVLAVILLLLSVVAIAHAVFHLHGELAGAEPSQQLMTPVGALVVTLVLPFGLATLLVTLGRVLNERSLRHGQPAPLAVGTLAFASLLLPPIAILRLQAAANRSYDLVSED